MTSPGITPRAITHRHRRAAVVLGAALALLLGWAAGLAWFVRTADRAQPDPPHADGIVALTGGAERVETALRLLAAGRADWLLVSGALVPRVQLDRRATSTRGNATQTAAWVKAKGIHSLIVVTAWYHMPRALTELRRALPDAVLYPLPVEPEGSHVPGLAMERLLAEEYTKYLAARLDLTALLPERPRPPARSTRPG
jgi:uncharacterized SAM-binding protein YcdF (DUF218 family)